MSRRRTIVVLYAVSAGLLLLNCVWLWRMVAGSGLTRLPSERQIRESLPPLTRPRPEPLDVQRWQEIYLFSSPPSPLVVEPASSETVPVVDASPPNFRVVSVLVSSLSGESLAVVASPGQERKQVVRIGQELDQYRLVELTVKAAVFERDGQRFSVLPEGTN